MIDTISMSSLVQIIKDICNGYEKIEYILMNIDDFTEMMRNDDLRRTTNTMGLSEDELLLSDAFLVRRPLCIFGIPIRPSKYICQGDICKVFETCIN